MDEVIAVEEESRDDDDAGRKVATFHGGLAKTSTFHGSDNEPRNVEQ